MLEKQMAYYDSILTASDERAYSSMGIVLTNDGVKVACLGLSQKIPEQDAAQSSFTVLMVDIEGILSRAIQQEDKKKKNGSESAFILSGHFIEWLWRNPTRIVR